MLTEADRNNMRTFLMPPTARRPMRPAESRKKDDRSFLMRREMPPVRDANEKRSLRSYAAAHGIFIPEFEKLARIVASMAHRQT
jgi:hypothetical protein